MRENELKKLIIKAKRWHSYIDMLDVLKIVQVAVFDPELDYFIENTSCRQCAQLIIDLRYTDLDELSKSEIVFLFEKVLHLAHSEPILRTILDLDLDFLEKISHVGEKY